MKAFYQIFPAVIYEQVIMVCQCSSVQISFDDPNSNALSYATTFPKLSSPLVFPKFIYFSMKSFHKVLEFWSRQKQPSPLWKWSSLFMNISSQIHRKDVDLKCALRCTISNHFLNFFSPGGLHQPYQLWNKTCSVLNFVTHVPPRSFQLQLNT